MFVCNFLNFQRIFFHFIPRCFYIFGSFFYNLTTSFIRAVKKYRYVFFDDSGFFSRNLFNRISKDLCVIQSDRCDHAQKRMLEGISRIQPSTKSCLQYNILRIILFKCKHTHSIQEFKIRRMFQPFLFQFFCHLPYLCKNPAEGIIVNIFSIDPDPLVELHQMWRCKKSNTLSLKKKNRLHICADASLSVRPCHMKNLSSLAGIPQSSHKFTGMQKRMLLCKFWYVLYIPDYFFILHNLSRLS